MPNYNDAQGVADLLSQSSRIRSRLIPSPKSRRSPVLPRRSRKPVAALASSNRTVMTGRRPSVRMSVPMGTLRIR